MACNDKNAFFTSEQPKQYKLWSCQKMCDALNYLLDNIFLRLGSKLYRQIVGIPTGTKCAPLVADCFCFVMRETFFRRLTHLTRRLALIHTHDIKSIFLCIPK